MSFMSHRFAKNAKRCHPPEQWEWSSYRGYAFGEEGAVKLNQWPEARLNKTQGAA